MKPVAMALCALLALPAIARASDEPDEPRQPLQELVHTEVVYPQEKGELQLTFGSLFDHGDEADSLALPLGVEYGLTDAWQVGLEWGSFRRVGADDVNHSGIGDISLGTKYSFMNMAGGPLHSAIGVEMTFARALDALHEESGREIEPFVAFAADFDRINVQLFTHVGFGFEAGEAVALVEDDEEGGADLEWNAGALVPLGSFTLATEFTVRNETLTVRTARESYVTPSISFHLPRQWEIGVGVPVGLTEHSDRVGLAVHVVYER